MLTERRNTATPPANPDALMVDALEAVKETKIWVLDFTSFAYAAPLPLGAT
jgi:hypothetical protein